MSWALSARASRAVVFVGMSSGVALSAYVVYRRNVDSDPLRIARDADGVMRWMSAKEMVLQRLQAARVRAAANPDDVSASGAVQSWEAALAREEARMDFVHKREVKAADLKL